MAFFNPGGALGHVLILGRNPDNDTRDESDMDDSPEPLNELEAAMRPLLMAIQAKDLAAMAQCFRDACEIADLEPHDEYPHGAQSGEESDEY